MRRVTRRALPPPTQGALDRRQQKADQKRAAAGTLNVQSTWNSARKTRPLATVPPIPLPHMGQPPWTFCNSIAARRWKRVIARPTSASWTWPSERHTKTPSTSMVY